MVFLDLEDRFLVVFLAVVPFEEFADLLAVDFFWEEDAPFFDFEAVVAAFVFFACPKAGGVEIPKVNIAPRKIMVSFVRNRVIFISSKG